MKKIVVSVAGLVGVVGLGFTAPVGASYRPSSYPILCQGNFQHTTLTCEENPPVFWPAHQFVVTPLGGNRWTDLPTDSHHLSFKCVPVDQVAPTTLYGCVINV